MKNYFENINNAISQLHYVYGVGDIKEIRQFSDGKLEIDALKTSARKVHTRRGRIETNGVKRTIFIYGHQLTVILMIKTS